MDTSRAARPKPAKAYTLREKALEIIRRRRNGVSVHEVAEALHVPVASVQPRISELKADGRIKDTGRRRRNASGHIAAIFAAQRS